jgi:uncharacterized protein
MTPSRNPAALVLACLLLAAPAGRGAEPARLLEGFARADAMIETRLACHILDIYLARTPDERAQGLMYIRELGEFEGMLFPTSEPAMVSMWMKNTYIPLDMVFMRANGTVTSIAANTTPFSEDIVSSQQAVTGVLELNGGFAARHGVRAGDHFQIIR